MNEEYVFQPERRIGYIVHLIGMAALALAGLLGIYRASLADISLAFFVFLLPTLAALVFIPVLAYRLTALRNGLYVLEREGLHVRWGLRVEDIPIERIQWVHRPAELVGKVQLPRFHWPGAVLGVRRMSRAERSPQRLTGWSAPQGEVEFLASDVSRLVLVSTPNRVYAISPANPETFILAFERCMEMGSLAPIQPHSVYPTFLLSRVWSALPARLLLLAGLGLSLVLLAAVAVMIPGRAEVTLGARPGFPGDAVPAVQLMLLPVISTGFFLVDFFLGLFFFRQTESQPLSYILWASAAATPLVFLTAVFFIWRTG